MKNNLHYDCVLRAAYMTKEFNINIVFQEDVERLPDVWHKTYGVDGFYTRNHHDIITSSLEIGNSRRQEIINRKFYVHPNSFDMFKPQVGDLCSYEQQTAGDTGDIDIVFGIYNKEAFECIGLQIIQRNGKQFFTPKRNKELANLGVK